MRGFEKLSVADIERRNLKISVPKRHKFGAEKTPVDGYVFDSKREASRYLELKMLVAAHEIDALEIQPKFPIFVRSLPNTPTAGADVYIGDYTADFAYWEPAKPKIGVAARRVVEDVKSKATKTTAYKLRKRLVEAIYGVEITEI